jgi:cytoskeletal protein CcmA (bactofilin family)
MRRTKPIGNGWLAVFVAAAIGGATALPAAEFRSGEKVVIKRDEVVEGDLYVFGGEVRVDGTIQGDLVSFAGQVAVSGDIEGDLIAAGQSVLVTGSVGDDIRMAGQALKIASGATVADDVIAAGFSLEVEEDSRVEGDIVYVGYQLRLAGAAGKNVTGMVANGELSGSVAGDVELEIGGDEGAPPPNAFGTPPPISMPIVPPGLTVRESARIEGKLTYTSPWEGDIDEAAEIAGGVKHERPAVTQQAEPTVADQALELARRLACLAIVGLCVVLLAPRWSRGVSDSIKGRPLASLGVGLVGIILFVVLLVVLVILIVVLAIVFGLLTLGDMVPVVLVVGLLSLLGLLGGFWLFISYVAHMAVSLALSRFVFFRSESDRLVLPFLVGLVIVTILSNLPHVGPFLVCLVVLLGFGGLVLWILAVRGPARPAAAVSAPQEQ